MPDPKKEEDGIVVTLDNEEELKARAKAIGLAEDATEEEIKKKEEEAKPREEDTIAVKKDELEKMKKQINYASGSYRIIEKLEREIEDLKKEKPAPPAEDKDTQNINKLLEDDLVGGIEKIVEKRLETAEKKRKESSQLEQMEEERDRQLKLLNDNQAKVLKDHPELADPTSEKTKIWLEVLEKHPEYKTNYLGPLQAMRDMEGMLEEKGNETKDKGAIDKEIARRKRAEQANLGPGNKSTTKSNEVVLSKEQKELCDLHGWDYKQYARTLKRMSGEKQVEVE